MYTFALSFGSTTSVCVCEPRHVCTAAICFGFLRSRDVEDADAAEPLGADRRLDALGAAVDPAARLFHRHEQQVPVHRNVPLPPGAHDRREEPRLSRILDLERVEAVEIAEERRALPLNAMSELAKFSRSTARRSATPAPARSASAPAERARAPVGSPAGCLGSKKPCGFGRLATSSMFPRRLAGIAQPRLQPDPRIGLLRARLSPSMRRARARRPTASVAPDRHL